MIDYKRLFTTVRDVVLLLRKGEDENAKEMFNGEILPIYSSEIDFDKTFEPLKFFIMELDDYLNDEAARILGVTDLNELISSFLEMKKEIKASL